MKDLLRRQIIKHKRPIKYLIAGGTAALVDLSLIYFFTDILGIWYLYSACLAFSVAFFVSFFLQKFWTFRDNNTERMYRQMTVYLSVALFNLILNAFFMYILVDGFKVWYMLAQVMASGLIACESYLVSSFFIFFHHRLDKNKLKIIIATGIYPPDIGGPAQYAKNLAEQFKQKGSEVEVLSYQLEKRLPIIIRHIYYFFRLVFKSRGADLIIALDTFSVGMPAVIAAKIFKKKIIIRTGGDFLWETYIERSGKLITLEKFYENLPPLNFKEKIIFSLSKYILKNAAVVVFSTAWQKDIFEKYYQLNPQKSRIIENYFVAQKDQGQPVKEKIFLWAGRPVKLKNLEKLKQAFIEAQKNNPDLKLSIVQSMPYEKLLEVIKKSYAVILPSLTEISPNYILDALSCSKPFILTEETGFREKLSLFGLFVNPLDEADIKDKILFLADDKNYNEYRNKAMNFNYRHTWEEITEEFLNIYKNL